MWCLLMYAGSRTAVDGFPVRFESDLGAPLSVAGALGAGMLLQSLPQLRATKATAMVVTSVAAAGALIVFIVLQAAGNILTDIQTQGAVLHRPLAVAGEWLRRHNTGGTIISTPGMNPGITNRAVLALGDYQGLQSYFHSRFENPRSLPPAGSRCSTRTRCCCGPRAARRGTSLLVTMSGMWCYTGPARMPISAPSRAIPPGTTASLRTGQ